MTDRRKIISNKLSKYFRDFNKWWLVLICLILLSGIYARFTNLFNLGFEFDTIQTQYEWAKNALQLGYGRFWSDYTGGIDYLPGALFLGMSFAWIGNILNPILPGDGAQAFVTVMKFFNMLVDLSIAVTCYYIARNYAHSSKEKSTFIAALVFSMPSLWFISNVWGQFDSLVVALGLASVILMYHRNKIGGHAFIFKDLAFWSGILFAIGFWLKPLIILLIPLILLYQFSNKPLLKVKEALLTSFMWLLIASGMMMIGVYVYYNISNYTPWLLSMTALFFVTVTIFSYLSSKKGFQPLTSLYRQGFGFWIGSWIIATLPIIYNPVRVGQMLALPFTKENVVSAGASTFWPLVGVDSGADASMKLFDFNGIGLSVALVGMIIFVVLMVLIYLRFQGIKLNEILSDKYSFNSSLERLLLRKLSFANFAILTTILGSTYFLFLTKMHSRYLIWAIVFSFVALAAVSNKRGWKTWLIMLLIMHFGYFLNQLGVFSYWYQYLPWTQAFLDSFNLDSGKLSSLCVFLGYIGFYLWTWRYSNPHSSLINHIID